MRRDYNTAQLAQLDFLCEQAFVLEQEIRECAEDCDEKGYAEKMKIYLQVTKQVDYLRRHAQAAEQVDELLAFASGKGA